MPGRSDNSPTRSRQCWLRYGCCVGLLLAIAFFTWIRFHLRNVPLERDEGEFAYMGQLIRQGIPPYKLACNMKLPGTYAAYAVMMAIFGETTAGIHIGVILVNAAATILVFLLGKYLYGWLAGAVAGVTYAFLSIRPALLALDGHATHFVVLAALAGILLLLHAIDGGRTGLFFASGFCFGLAFLMKQPGILFGIFAGLYWLWREWTRPLPSRNLMVRGGALAAGTTLPFGLTCLLLLRAGVLPNFWFWTWSYARAYGSIASWSLGWLAMRTVFPWVVRPFAIWEVALVGLTAPLWNRYARAHGGFLASFFLFSWLAVCPGLYFRPHYFILVLPAAALCTGIGVEAARQSLLERRFSPLMVWFPALYFALIFVIAVHSQYQVYFRMDPVALSRKMLPNQPHPEAVLVADYIKAHSSPQDQIGIMGSEPEICFYAGRHCATRYMYMRPLMERQKFARQMQNEMRQEMESARPRFLVYVDSEQSWGWKPTLQENMGFFDWAWNYAHSGYQLVDQLPIPGDGNHLWGSEASIYVFRRKEE